MDDLERRINLVDATRHRGLRNQAPLPLAKNKLYRQAVLKTARFYAILTHINSLQHLETLPL